MRIFHSCSGCVAHNGVEGGVSYVVIPVTATAGKTYECDAYEEGGKVKIAYPEFTLPVPAPYNVNFYPVIPATADTYFCLLLGIGNGNGDLRFAYGHAADGSDTNWDSTELAVANRRIVASDEPCLTIAADGTPAFVCYDNTTMKFRKGSVSNNVPTFAGSTEYNTGILFATDGRARPQVTSSEVYIQRTSNFSVYRSASTDGSASFSLLISFNAFNLGGSRLKRLDDTVYMAVANSATNLNVYRIVGSTVTNIGPNILNVTFNAQLILHVFKVKGDHNALCCRSDFGFSNWIFSPNANAVTPTWYTFTHSLVSPEYVRLVCNHLHIRARDTGTNDEVHAVVRYPFTASSDELSRIPATGDLGISYPYRNGTLSVDFQTNNLVFTPNEVDVITSGSNKEVRTK